MLKIDVFDGTPNELSLLVRKLSGGLFNWDERIATKFSNAENSWTVVAYLDGVEAGFIYVRHGQQHTVAVHPDFRGQGIVNEMQNKIIEQGVTEYIHGKEIGESVIRGSAQAQRLERIRAISNKNGLRRA